MQSIESIPTWFSDYWGISLEAGQIILSLVLILAVLLPVLIVARGKGLTIPSIIFILVEALLVGIGWLPSWLMIVTVVLIALFWAREASDLVGS